MKLSSLPNYSSKWLKAVDLQNKSWDMQITQSVIEPIRQMNGTMEQLCVLTLKGATKRFIVNKTAGKILESAFGDVENFVGKTIRLTPGKTPQGKETINIFVSNEYEEPPVDVSEMA